MHWALPRRMNSFLILERHIVQHSIAIPMVLKQSIEEEKIYVQLIPDLIWSVKVTLITLVPVEQQTNSNYHQLLSSITLIVMITYIVNQLTWLVLIRFRK